MAKLSSLKIGEVSFCRKGMNKHARVALFKSMDTSPQALAKATFEEALEGNMIAGAVNEAFYQSFDGLWERNDAFRAALADEFAEGGDGTKASAAYVASVKSLVDEAVSNARAAGATAADTGAIDKALTDAADAWLLTKFKPEEKIMKFANKAALMASVTKFNPATTTVAEVAEIQKAAAEFGCEADLPVALAKTAEPDAALVRKVAILEMPADVRKHFDGLTDETAQTAFLAKSADERAADVEKANATDPVVHKCFDGTEIRKSDGATVLALAKGRDADQAELAKLRGTVVEGTLEKRAAAFPNVAKATAVAMLKSADTVGVDTDEGKDILKNLGTMNASSGRLHKALGTTEAGGEGEGSLAKSRADFGTKVSDIAKRDSCDTATAMSKARAEHADLFAEAYPESVEAEVEA